MDLLIIFGTLFLIGVSIFWAIRNRRLHEGNKFDALGQSGALSKRLCDLMAADYQNGESEPQEVSSAVLGRALKNMQSLQSYCAMMSITSMEDEREIATWRYDVALPDKFHARQAVHIENWLDEWISIGNEEYRCSGFWVRSPDANDKVVNRSANVAVLAALISKNKPSECHRCLMLGDEFFRFVFLPPYDFGMPSEKLLFGSDEDTRDGSFCLFVNYRNFMVERATLTKKSRLGNDLINVTLQISLGAFDEDIIVEMPTELLPVVDENGVPQIRMDLDPTVPFHEWSA